MFIRSVGGPEPIRPVSGEKVSTSKANKGEVNVAKDNVEISQDAIDILQRQKIKEIASNIVSNIPDVSQEAIEKGRKFIESGEYKSSEAIEKVANRITEEILAKAIVDKEDNS